MWKGKTVVVAGGSKGLGAKIARAFHDQGSRVVVLARTKQPVDELVAQFNDKRSESAIGYSIDLSDDQARRTLIDSIVQSCGTVDVWVNAVGQSTRTKLEATDLAAYRQLMEQNFFVSVGCSLDVLPYLKRSHGSLVLIGSLAAKTGWPLVGPYVTSKHALAGFAHQLRIEGPGEVHFLFVCPGPIADSDLKRYQRQSDTKDGNAGKPGAGAPVRAIDPERLAAKILAACETKKSELVVPFKARFLFTILQLWPGLGDRLIKKFLK